MTIIESSDLNDLEIEKMRIGKVDCFKLGQLAITF